MVFLVKGEKKKVSDSPVYIGQQSYLARLHVGDAGRKKKNKMKRKFMLLDICVRKTRRHRRRSVLRGQLHPRAKAHQGRRRGAISAPERQQVRNYSGIFFFFLSPSSTMSPSPSFSSFFYKEKIRRQQDSARFSALVTNNNQRHTPAAEPTRKKKDLTLIIIIITLSLYYYISSVSLTR